jgi:hypothetical protein
MSNRDNVLTDLLCLLTILILSDFIYIFSLLR